MMKKKFINLTNIFRSVYHYKKGSTVLPYFPNALWIEPTNVCNLRCIMCPNSIVKQKNPGFMDLDLYKKIIDEVKDEVSHVILCISGESLLHKKFADMVEYAHCNGISTSVSTNCTQLTPALSKKLLKASLDWINFSFDGCSKEVYEKVRVNANFEKTLKNVTDFLKIKNELGAKIHCDLQILVMDEKGMKDYESNISNFVNNFKDLPLDYIQVRQPSTWGKYFKNTDKFKPKNLGSQFSPCSYLWSSLHILWDGRIVACTSDFFGTNILGKYPQQSLKEIWNGKKMVEFRKAMNNKKYQKFNKNCEACDSLWERRIFGLPPGIRGISVSALNSVLGLNLFGFFKKIAKIVSPGFSMWEVSRKK